MHLFGFGLHQLIRSFLRLECPKLPFVLQFAFAVFYLYFEENHLVFLCFKSSLAVFVLSLAFSVCVFGQATPLKPNEKKPDEKKAASTSASKDASKSVSVEQVLESSIVIYAFPGGRPILDQIRKTAFERGKTITLNAEGKMENANYQRWTMRGTALSKEKVRFDQEFPSVSYSLVQSDEKVFGVFNDSVFTPREDAAKAFENQIYRGLDAFLRYKENESKFDLAGKEKHMGVEFYLVDITDKQGRKTRFYVSVKSFRVMMLDYEDEGKKYKRKFYNYNYAQGTLVPFKSVLYQDGKIIEETEIGTITYGQKVDDGLFVVNP